MARFYNKVGFSKTIETSPGVWEEQITERYYYGDILKNYKRWQSSEKLIDDINVDQQISIVADNFAYENLGYMRYVYYRGSKWKINSLDDSNRPRIVLNLGGLYNG
jgi:predicted nuclease of restriction endonuclease-like (RecB) superfamily